MRLLFDQNLSDRLPLRLNDLYADALHIAMVGLERASDEEVWQYARDHDCIVTKDSDFRDLSLLHSFPPRVVWLRIGNCSSLEIEQLLRRSHSTIAAFASEATTGLLTLIGR